MLRIWKKHNSLLHGCFENYRCDFASLCVVCRITFTIHLWILATATCIIVVAYSIHIHNSYCNAKSNTNMLSWRWGEFYFLLTKFLLVSSFHQSKFNLLLHFILAFYKLKLRIHCFCSELHRQNCVSQDFKLWNVSKEWSMYTNDRVNRPVALILKSSQ